MNGQPFVEVGIAAGAALGLYFAVRAANRSRGIAKAAAIAAALFLVFMPIRIVAHPGRLIAGIVIASAVIVFGARLRKVLGRFRR